MSPDRRRLVGRIALIGLLVLTVAAVGGFLMLRAWVMPQLPSVASLHEIRLGVPLRVYTRDGKLIGEFGAERREPLTYAQLPKPLVQAFLAAEDDRFFEHSGVDVAGLARAAVVLATTGQKRQGGSTITMQLARNVYLTNERSFTRKIKEIFLARKIETELSKEQILELYLNRIFLGNRAYGVGAAASVYFGREVSKLTVGEMALIAGLPKAPSRDNPLNNADRAKNRRDYVLRRMHDLGYIDDSAWKTATAEPITAFEHPALVEVEASYVAEMVRAELYAKHGEATYTDGFVVTTTLDSTRQLAANAALRGGLLAYEERHGFNGAEAKLPPALLATLNAKPSSPEVLVQLAARPPVAGLQPAVVLSLTPDLLRMVTDNGIVELPKTAFAWAGFNDKRTLAAGDIVRIAKVGANLRLTQIPEVQGAFVALDPRDGGVQSLVGGYDFFLGNFNRVTQARRQVGSGFKPFLYTAALSKGYTPASIFLDAPVVFTSSVNPDDDWRPGNYEGKFRGPMRLRDALALSRNLVSVRVAQAVGIEYTREFASRFGFDKSRLPADLTVALGSASMTPMEQARAYAVFANGGFLIDPYFIASITDGTGREVFHARPKLACPVCDAPPPEPALDPVTGQPVAIPEPLTVQAAEPPVAPEDRAPRVLASTLDYLISSMLHDVVTRGTASQVRSLGRDDLAGKTATSNDETDAWFNGFSTTLVAVAWVGFDQPKPLGRGEVGGRAAVPMWMDYMKTALKGVPQQKQPRPPGLTDIAINPATGKLVAGGTPGSLSEVVQSDHLPPPDDGISPYGNPDNAAADIF
ncbi:penicillin-binding protein 1A [Nevskia ramosa]|uniref:penicillin-binding protein 1A n=1 Tax=Nevskia ramosa TaxID=64002 RepID=UPI0003B53CFF|nr:penicillin-binding protein 1A [Nevskia ramosa]